MCFWESAQVLRVIMMMDGVLHTGWINFFGSCNTCCLLFYVFWDGVWYNGWINFFGSCNTCCLLFYVFGNLHRFCVFIMRMDGVLYTGGRICRFLCFLRWVFAPVSHAYPQV